MISSYATEALEKAGQQREIFIFSSLQFMYF